MAMIMEVLVQDMSAAVLDCATAEQKEATWNSSYARRRPDWNDYSSLLLFPRHTPAAFPVFSYR